ncbi:MAG TPA: type II toxin-antitoxin system HipA family toxin [Candidatus Goldiibacteriota bacterium]|nr:type II toxin-antitoxin system HipA family toxin [Candidatus Goldiibacteriota bacterium]
MNSGKKTIEVFIHGKKAGRLGLAKSGVYVFEYDGKFLEAGFSLSPFHLPLKAGVFTAKPEPFSGMFGVFSDSLPDGWGRLLIDRVLIKNRIDPGSLTQADRLSLVGRNGMGALEYRPENSFFDGGSKASISMLAAEIKKVLNENYTGHIEVLVKKGGSSGGARPKALIHIKGEAWIVKFPNSNDSGDSGRMEYEYSLAAKKCGIEMPQTALLENKYFGVKRFDRRGKKKIHMHTAAGLLYADYRIPSLDYMDIMKATLMLTKNMAEVAKIFRLMVFNILSHNRDDHAKNFSFVHDGEKWAVSPAYDLTYSHGFNGQHTTVLLGNGLPGRKEIMEAGRLAGIKAAEAAKTYEAVDAAVKPLKKYFR